MKVLGVDEAGRGALVGPLVIGGFMIDDDKLPLLSQQGVTDSKLLSPERRSELSSWLKSVGSWRAINISPVEIDLGNKTGVNLTQLELLRMIDVINDLMPDKVIIDCPSVNLSKVKGFIESKVDCEVVCEFKADLNFPVVGAGSIIAKVTRDLAINDLERELGAVIGAGYPSDDRTIDFARLALSNPLWLKHVRHSWSTFSRIKSEFSQKRLGDFS